MPDADATIEAASDEALARRIAGGLRGSTDAEEAELYRRFAPRVRLYGRRHLQNDAAADDLAQDVLLLTIERLRADTAEIVHRRWAGLSGGMTAFLALQCLIMAACLAATGAYPGPAETVAVFALSRVLTTALVTPSGAGIMEGGVAALLVAP